MKRSAAIATEEPKEVDILFSSSRFFDQVLDSVTEEQFVRYLACIVIFQELFLRLIISVRDTGTAL